MRDLGPETMRLLGRLVEAQERTASATERIASTLEALTDLTEKTEALARVAIREVGSRPAHDTAIRRLFEVKSGVAAYSAVLWPGGQAAIAEDGRIEIAEEGMEPRRIPLSA